MEASITDPRRSASRSAALSRELVGRLALAERELRLAIAAGTAADEPYFLAEAYHNLAHTYEGAGRFAEPAARRPL